jgi:rfaE bifunctional protein nucleotidyltransferase chain/domain
MGRVISKEELLRKRQLWREAGRTVVFTNGCFDLIHVGHIRSIQDAAELGDILVVGLNSDESVRKLKGSGRPLQEESSRGEVVASIRGVDYVCFFEEPSADVLIRLLQPDVHAKGTDYTEGNVPERDSVLSYGGRIAITGDPKEHSTKDLIGEIRRRCKLDNS